MSRIKIGILSGLTFGILMGVYWLLLGLFFPTWLGISSSNTAIANAIFQGVFGGVLFGIFLPLGTSFFVKYQTRKFQKENETWLQSMTILYSDAASHFMGLESVGGHLILTPEALFFKSHKFNIQNHILEIPLKQCANVSIVNYCYFVPTGMQIETTGGKIEKFVVNHRKAWIEKIQEAVSHKKAQSNE